MRFLLLFLLGMFSCGIYGQERELITAVVVKNDSVVQNVHVRNVSFGKYSVTNKKGEFSIHAMAGDTLVLSHVSTMDYIKTFSNAEMQQKPLMIVMQERSNELDEVVLNEYSDINAVSLGIIPHEIETPTLNERRLHTAGDFKPIHLLGLLGGSLQVDPILNAINGRTKRLKRNIRYENKEVNIAFLRNRFSEYMRENMGLSEEDILKLTNFAIGEENAQVVIDSGNEEQVKFFLQDTWIKLQKL
ncbi:hypothetical protein [Salinimicrobium sp. GXAS 041]|uniref:hypothetical protein n=1 Tax=Salinimicrobium sp. GXAS 041 TaxID=3400806 RepID=UPI003C78FD73